ncbi:DNA-directed RNA polymerase subunit beta [Sinobaca sp. H24]|uniref:DNA-directed RNA polymerase subunit beta n=1 Tax=Sinobaca sp. H24 TaxID=2923376 RepID=UPI0020799735|nr:DNA-directed RNA polymerase subunit beta [Sinobaca sp. H24]
MKPGKTPRQGATRTEQRHREKTAPESGPTHGEKDDKSIPPLWKRLTGLLIALLILAFVGLIVGYLILGDGESLHVLNPVTWIELLRFVTGR